MLSREAVWSQKMFLSRRAGLFFLDIVVHRVSRKVRASCIGRSRFQKNGTGQAVTRGRRAQRYGSRTRERSAVPRGANRRRWRCWPTRTCRRQSPAKSRLRPCGEAQRAVPPSAVPGAPTTHRCEMGPQPPGSTHRCSRPGAALTTTRSRSRAAMSSALTSCWPSHRRTNSSVVCDKDVALELKATDAPVFCKENGRSLAARP